jgi:hypothetical protein
VKKLKLKEGDVFTIPLGNDYIGYGQITTFPNSRDVFVLCVFDFKNIIGVSTSLEAICNSPIIFLGYSTDAKLYYKDWEILGNFPGNLSNVKLPYYKIGIPPNDLYLVNFKGERLKEIGENIFAQLNYQANFAPIRYENALKAYYGFSEWKKDDYDKLLYQQTLNSIDVANKVLL